MPNPLLALVGVIAKAFAKAWFEEQRRLQEVHQVGASDEREQDARDQADAARLRG